VISYIYELIYFTSMKIVTAVDQWHFSVFSTSSTIVFCQKSRYSKMLFNLNLSVHRHLFFCQPAICIIYCYVLNTQFSLFLHILTFHGHFFNYYQYLMIKKTTITSLMMISQMFILYIFIRNISNLFHYNLQLNLQINVIISKVMYPIVYTIDWFANIASS